MQASLFWVGSNCPACFPALPSRSSLSGAGLSGSIPVGGWSLPETLTVIDLGTNAINGSLPAQWYLPERLETLWMVSAR